MQHTYDPAVVAALQAWMKRHSIQMNCPLCGSPAWSSGFICEMPEKPTTGKAFPVILLTCNQCAYTVFFGAAAVMGVVHQPHQP
jgi:hypothetical protein